MYYIVKSMNQRYKSSIWVEVLNKKKNENITYNKIFMKYKTSKTKECHAIIHIYKTNCF
jgi:hypothetical protein